MLPAIRPSTMRSSDAPTTADGSSTSRPTATNRTPYPSTRRPDDTTIVASRGSSRLLSTATDLFVQQVSQARFTGRRKRCTPRKCTQIDHLWLMEYTRVYTDSTRSPRSAAFAWLSSHFNLSIIHKRYTGLQPICNANQRATNSCSNLH